MGKAENIKRAKRLKEAKRLREQSEMIAAGIGPAGRVIMQKSAEAGNIVRLNTGPVKYSDLLKEFVFPILSDTDTPDTMIAKFQFGAHAWNVATARDRNEKAFQNAKKEVASLMPDLPEIEELFEELLNRKQEEFAEFTNIIVDLEVKRIKGMDFDLSVATIPLKEL